MSTGLSQEVLSPLLPQGFVVPPQPYSLCSSEISSHHKGNIVRNRDARCHCRLGLGSLQERGWGALGLAVSQVSIPRLTPGQIPQYPILWLCLLDFPSLCSLFLLCCWGSQGNHLWGPLCHTQGEWGEAQISISEWFITLLLLGDQGIPLIPAIPRGQWLRGYSGSCLH